jgi:two-component system LytT family response regulator
MQGMRKEATGPGPLSFNSGPLAAVRRPVVSLQSRPAPNSGTPAGMRDEVLRALIVDDEPIARKILREEVELITDVKLVGEAENGQEALEQIAAKEPDVVLLDLQMPVMGGFEVVRRLEGGKLPVVIAVTAYDQFAVQAFEAGAIDYLLKPVSQTRLLQALNRARALRSNALQVAESLARLQEAEGPATSMRGRKIVGRHGEDYFLLNADEVFAFQAEGDLVWIITAKQKYLATQTLRALQEKLASNGFERIHRNALVNLDHVRKMTALSSQRWLITLQNGKEFIVSKRQARGVRHLLNW